MSAGAVRAGLRARWALVCLCVPFAGCGGGWQDQPAPSSETVPAHVRVRAVELPSEVKGATLDLAFQVQRDEVGYLLRVQATDPSAWLIITRVVSPSGKVLHRESGPFEEPDIVSRLSNESWSGEGELSLFMPNAAGLEPLPGTWRIQIARPDGDELAGAELFAVRRVARGAGLRLDLALVDATRNGSFSSARSARRLRTDLAKHRALMDEVLAAHALAIGHLDIVGRLPRNLRGTVSTEDDSERTLCDAAVRMTAPWSLPVVIVDGFLGEHEQVLELAGWAPMPGALNALDSSQACVFVESHTYLENDEERNAAFAMTVLHEAGHFVGLDHVSSEDGRVHDRFDDTPECHLDRVDGRDNLFFDVPGEVDGLIDDFECGLDGGAGNVMFWSGVAEFAPFGFSAGQAEVMRKHPLFRPERAE